MGPLSSGALVFVIEGEFEIQDRLLHQKDGSWYRGTHNLEFERLPNEGIFLYWKFNNQKAVGSIRVLQNAFTIRRGVNVKREMGRISGG
jgi:hypothetical protein